MGVYIVIKWFVSKSSILESPVRNRLMESLFLMKMTSFIGVLVSTQKKKKSTKMVFLKLRVEFMYLTGYLIADLCIAFWLLGFEWAHRALQWYCTEKMSISI